MKIESLAQIPFSEIMDCFLEAFQNYFVKMPTDPTFYKERWEKAKVSYADSYGMFDSGRLVGFMIHAIDSRRGDQIAFNTGTGVIPEYRGQRIVQKLYDHCIPELSKKGITLLALEVITDNVRAVKAYEKVGFAITKRYKCYSGSFQLKEDSSEYAFEKVPIDHFDWSAMDQSYYSWDNQYETLSRGTFDYYIVSKNGREVGYFVINPESGYVAQFNVFEEELQHWNGLFKSIQQISETIRINNVDDRLTSKIEFLQGIQLKNTVDQYEMEMRI